MRSHTRGFTLIELLVVVAMIGILAGVLALNVTSSRASMNLDIGASSLKSALSLAQTMGRGGQIYPAGSDNPDRFDRGFGVYLKQGSNQIVTYGGLGPDANGTTRGDNVHDGTNRTETQTMPGSVKVSDICVAATPAGSCDSLGSDGEINMHFRRGRRETYLYTGNPADPLMQEVRITLAIDGVSDTREIRVFRTGLFYISD